MTKETMIWQTLSMIIAGMVRNKSLPATSQLFEKKVISDVMCILDYSEQDIKEVLHSTDCTEFAEVLAAVYTPKP